MTLPELTRLGPPRHVAAGTTILVEGEPVPGIFVLGAGRIRVVRSGSGGREGTLYLVEPGTLCSMSCLGVLRGVPSPARAVVEEDASGVLVEPAGFRAAFAADAAVRAAVLDAFARHFGAVIELLGAVQFQPIEARLASYLLDHAVVRTGGPGRGRLESTHERIAADMWTAREVVSRGLKSLERRGLLHVERGAVVIEDPDALEALQSGP